MILKHKFALLTLTGTMLLYSSIVTAADRNSDENVIRRQSPAQGIMTPADSEELHAKLRKAHSQAEIEQIGREIDARTKRRASERGIKVPKPRDNARR